jgi:DNA-binding MarR family transcriptional regulator
MNEDQIRIVSDALHAFVLKLRVDRLDAWSEKLQGLTPLQLHILKLVEERPNLLLGEIRRTFGIPQSTLTSAVDRLEFRGLVRRVINPRDLRSFGLELTEEGALIQQEHDRVDKLLAAKMLQCLETEEKRQSCCRIMAEIAEKMK